MLFGPYGIYGAHKPKQHTDGHESSICWRLQRLEKGCPLWIIIPNIAGKNEGTLNTNPLIRPELPHSNALSRKLSTAASQGRVCLAADKNWWLHLWWSPSEHAHSHQTACTGVCVAGSSAHPSKQQQQRAPWSNLSKSRVPKAPCCPPL